MRQWLAVCLLLAPGLAVPRFEVYWESEGSYLYNEDELHNPWYIDLGAIDAGTPGYIGGPNVVTIHAADYCTYGCQELYPDEFCSQYPPEGVPAKPRTVEDWGTKFNITANMMREGIEQIHQRGGKVNLAFGGRFRTGEKNGLGISAENGGGSKNVPEDNNSADKLANRIAQNIINWNLDGVDFFMTGPDSGQYWNGESQTYMIPGHSATFHFSVIKALRTLYLPSDKTISYSTSQSIDFVTPSLPSTWHHATTMSTVIAASHPYLDWISMGHGSMGYSGGALDDANLDTMAALGIPLAKVGVVFTNEGIDPPTTEEMVAAVEKIKARGLAGITLFSINEENRVFRGAFARMVAELLYL